MKTLLLFLLFLGTVPNLGFFNLPAFLIISASFAIFTALLLIGKRDEPDNPHLLFCLLFLSLIYYGGLYQNKSSLLFGYILLFLAIGIAVLGFLRKSEKITQLSVIFSCSIYAVLSVWTIVNSPSPTVDTFVILKEAPIKLLSGINPYATTFSQVYSGINPDYFSYLPFSFLLTLPFVIVFSDPRVLIILANLFSSLIIYRVYKKRENVCVHVASFLFLPRSFYILEHSYLDPVIFGVFMTGLYLEKIGRERLASLVLGVTLFIRQDIWLLAPHIFRKMSRFIFILVPMLIVILFFFWNPGGFVKNIFLIYGPHQGLAPVSHSLSLPTLIGGYYILSGLIFLVLYILVLFSRKEGLIFKMAATIFFFNFFGYHSYYNHYFLVGMFLLFSIIAEKKTSPHAHHSGQL